MDADERTVRAVDTHCPYCALQCGMTLTRERDDTVTVAPRGGGLCQKGWTSPELLAHPDRITTPLVGGRPTGWTAALDLVAGRIRALQAEYGPGAVAVFGGGGLTNEKAYLLGKFARVALRTPNIDYNGRFCMSSAAAAGLRAFGVDRGMPFPASDLAEADTVLLAGANPAETMPPFMRHLAGKRLIVVDPRATATARQAHLHLRTAPGTDLALANGILHIAAERGHLDRAYIDGRTTGFAELAATVAGYWPARVERITGVAAADLYRAADLLAGGRRVILTARGAEQHAKGVDTVSAWINLALALGLPGRESSGFGTLTGQGNGQGGREHGQKADQLPGYRRIDDPVAREHVAGVWGVDPATLPGPGPSAVELLGMLGDEIKALLVFGSNPAVSAPRSLGVHERLSALDLLVVCDFLPSETARFADVVLPVTQWAEEEGTMTDLEGKVIRRRALRPPPVGVRSDLEVLSGLATRLGLTEGFDPLPGRVFEELRRASRGGTADYHGITYERLDAGRRLHWPCPDTDHDGTPRLFTDGRFHTPDGKARFIPVEHHGPAEPRDGEYPLYLTTGRVLTQYQSGAQTRRSSLPGEPFLQLHPDTAARHGITDGAPVLVTSRRGQFTAPARLDDTMRADTVFAPFHWPGANNAVNDALDPISRMPEFKVCAVRIRPHEETP
ncbi:molybdopterin oxidoreductase family protein [Phytomonospora endophytica]|uniref:Assimilatory nitrate reductase catalytic subunit n=1 Tax=Phytomonospora endophytica TaxID=714109 RepID=A0A841FHW8_9ACTN|nr:molybdopterin oxidoreductase family protein [Phytomonospora endophytica]MBB6033172.1 assimilatory nitrate reductase catalytic subunit [Phytomonospora endophytica]